MIVPPSDHRDELPPLEQVLLWCMRAWVIGFSRKIEVGPRIARMCAALQVPEAAGYLDGAMWAVGHGARRPVGIHCVCCEGLSADERLLLEVLELHQDERSQRAERLLRTLLRPAAAQAASDSAGRLVAALNAAGHRLAADPPFPGMGLLGAAEAACPALPRVLH
jgi:hypothetical protein